MKVIAPEMVTLWNDNQKAAQEANRQRREATKARFARDKLARESNLTMAPKYRPCPDGCGLTLLWANPGYHPTGEDLSPGPAAEREWMEEHVAEESSVPSLRPAASVAQVRWARDMIAQAPRKTQEQVARENHTSWEQLVYWARSSTNGLPERAAKKAPPPKAPTKKATTPKAALKAKAKEAKQAR
jgi:hypothetical protein